MKKHIKLFATLLTLVATLAPNFAVFAADDFANGFFVSPPNQNIILTPGEETDLTVTVSSPASSTKNFDYIATVVPYSISDGSDDDDMDFTTKKSYNDLVDWITLENATGSIAPNESATIIAHINVPSDAPGEGQYAAISVARDTTTQTDQAESTSDDSIGASVNETWAIVSIIYATVTGDTKSGLGTGEISNLGIPGFFSDNKISATSTVKNNGNVHQTATYTLEVYPLFSDEALYTNEENPETKTIMPGQTLTRSTSWDGAAPIGLYRIVEKVNFAGEDQSYERFVLVCPVWFLLLIVFLIVALIVYLVARAKNRSKARS